MENFDKFKLYCTAVTDCDRERYRYISAMHAVPVTVMQID